MSGTRAWGLLVLGGVILLPPLSAEERCAPEKTAADAALSDTLPPARMPVLGRDRLPNVPKPPSASAPQDEGRHGKAPEDKGKAGKTGRSADKPGKGPTWTNPPDELPKGLLKNLSKLLNKMAAKDKGPQNTSKSLPSQAKGKANGHNKPRGKP